MHACPRVLAAVDDLRARPFDLAAAPCQAWEGHVGGTAADNRLFVEAVLYRYRAGIPWRDLPERFGDWKIVHKRMRRWCEGGVCERIFKHLAADHDNEYMMLDSTAVRAHQHSAGAQKGGTRRSADPVGD